VGPFIQDVSNPDKLNTSIKAIWALSHGGKKEEELSNPGGSFVDVRNVAQAHVQALVRAEGGNERFVVSSSNYTFQDVADVIHSTKLSLPSDWKKNTPVGKKGNGASVKQNHLDGSKAEKVLGIKYYDLQQTIEGSLEAFIDYEKRDWKGVPSEDIVYLK
jgi:nucleoside-diphosphate-sugar epimerase